MAREFDMPDLVTHQLEQAPIQATKHRGRTLRAINCMVFDGVTWEPPETSAVIDFLRPWMAGDITIQGLLRGMHQANQGGSVHWADLGAGRALAMRELQNQPEWRERLDMTAVDLFDWGLEGLSADELEHLESTGPGMTGDHARPEVCISAMETVTLPRQADLITAFASIQHSYNPLQTITNAYNQLVDDGLLLIHNGLEWSKHIRYARGSTAYRQALWPTQHLLAELKHHDIKYEASDELNYLGVPRQKLDPRRFRSFVVQKKTGTWLRLTADVVDVAMNNQNESLVYYEDVTRGDTPVVEVVQAT